MMVSWSTSHPFLAVMMLLSLGRAQVSMNVEEDGNLEQRHQQRSMLVAEEDALQRLPLCRQDPTWSTTVEHHQCQGLFHWQGRNNTSMQSVDDSRDNDKPLSPVLDNDTDAKIKECLDNSFAVAKEKYAWARCEAIQNTDKKCIVKPIKKRGHYYRDNEQDGDPDEIVILSDVFTEQEAYGVEALDKCIREIFDNDTRFYKAREFGSNQTAPSYGMFRDDGGNYCTFLNGLVQTYLPGVAAATFSAVQFAYEQSQWTTRQNLPPPISLGVHSAEFLQYRTNGKLGLHVDDDTIYSISVALSRFDDYDGGYFQLLTPEAKFKVPRRSAIVFFGKSLHGVTDIQQGERKVFVMELWDQADAPIGSTRPNKDDVYANGHDQTSNLE